MRLKNHVGGVLRRVPPLFRVASRMARRLDSSFSTLSPGTPEAIHKALQLAKENASGPGVGDYYEFGLFRGYTFLSAKRACDDLGLPEVRFYGFDSFAGLPPVEGVDEGDGQFFAGQFACSRATVEKHLTENGMDWSRAALIEGFFDVSLTEELRTRHPFRPAGVVLLDCDLYSSTADAIRWLEPYLTAGTIILFDDWNSYGDSADLGQPKAFSEYLERTPHLRAEMLWDFSYHGRAFRLMAS